MSDPSDLTSAIEAARDAFTHAHGEPVFEPPLNASSDAGDGEVPIQKACRLLELNTEEQVSGGYYGAIVEHSFIAIEHTLQGYLLEFTGVERHDLRDHETPYEASKERVPLDSSTLGAIKALYDDRRNDHYYGTTVTTVDQADTLHDVARVLHDYIVSQHHVLENYCNCNV